MSTDFEYKQFTTDNKWTTEHKALWIKVSYKRKILKSVFFTKIKLQISQEAGVAQRMCTPYRNLTGYDTCMKLRSE